MASSDATCVSAIALSATEGLKGEAEEGAVGGGGGDEGGEQEANEDAEVVETGPERAAAKQSGIAEQLEEQINNINGRIR